MDALSDRLVLRAQKGDKIALGELYSLYVDKLYAYLHAALKNRDDAEEGAQQVFLQAMEALDGYEVRPGEPFRAWLFMIARHYAARCLKIGARLSLLDDPDQIEALYEEQMGGAEDEPDPPDLDEIRNGGLDEAFVRLIRDPDLLVCMRLLPSDQREVLALQFALEMDTSEIARTLDRSAESVRQLRHRALRFLEGKLVAAGKRPERRHERATMIVMMRPQNLLRARRFALAGDLRPLAF